MKTIDQVKSEKKALEKNILELLGNFMEENPEVEVNRLDYTLEKIKVSGGKAVKTIKVEITIEL
jgi:hypothetical protein